MVFQQRQALAAICNIATALDPGTEHLFLARHASLFLAECQ